MFGGFKRLHVISKQPDPQWTFSLVYSHFLALTETLTEVNVDVTAEKMVPNWLDAGLHFM